MRYHKTVVALSLIGSVCTIAAAQEGSAVPPGPARVDAPPAPMEPFARLVGGEWEMTLASGEKPHQAWQWGPGRYSVRKMEYGEGVAAGADSNNPWGGEVMYWHPGRKEVRVLSVHGDIPAVGRGVGEGTIRFEGDVAEGLLDLYQPRGPRKLGTRWTFDGTDKYHDALLEDSGAGLRPLAAWDFVRIPTRAEPRTVAAAEAPTGKLTALKGIVGHLWETEGEAKVGAAGVVQTTIEWIPSLQVVYAQTAALTAGRAVPQLDAYIYEHVKMACCGVLCCRGPAACTRGR